MAKQTIKQRIALDGGNDIKAELEALGAAGAKAFRQLQRAADQLKGPPTGFEARLKAIQLQFKTMARDFSVAGEKIAAAGRNLTAAITLPIAGAGIASIKAAADFESGFANIATAIDTSKESIADMEKSVLDLGKRVPVSLADLTDALYDIRSAGIAAGDAMTVLEGSAKLAVAGLGTTKEAADVATSAINAFGLKGADQAKIYNLFFDAINTGKTTLSGLAQGFGNVAGTVHAAGIELDDFLAAVAALTTTGETASVAYTQIQQTIAGLTRQTKDSQKVFAELGVKTFSDLIRKSGSFVAALQRIVKATGGDTATILKLVGSTEALNAVLQLTGAQGKAYLQTLDQMRSGTDDLTLAFDKQNKTINSQFIVLQNNIKAVAVSFGKLLLPAAQKFAEAAERLVAAVDSLDGSTKGLIATWGGYAAAAGPVLIGLGLLSKAISFVFRVINELIGSTRIIYQLLKTNPYVRVAAIILSVGEALGLFKNKQQTAGEAAEAHKRALDDLDAAILHVKEGVPGAADALKQLAQTHLDAARAAIADAKAQVEAAKQVLQAAKDSQAASKVGPLEQRLGQDVDPALDEYTRAEIKLARSTRELDELQAKIAGKSISNIEDLRNTTQAAGDAIATADQKAQQFTSTITVLKSGANGFEKTTFGLVDGVVRGVQQADDAAKKTGQTADDISTSFRKVGDSAKASLAELPKAAQTAVDGAKAQIDRLNTAVQSVGAAPAVQAPQGGQEGQQAAPAPGLAQTFTALQTQLQTATDAIIKSLGDLQTQAGTAFDAIVSSSMSAAAGIVDSFDGLSTTIGQVFAGVVAAVQAQFDGLKTSIDGMISSLTADLNRLRDAIASAKAQAGGSSDSGSDFSFSLEGHADGGLIRGRGGPRSDSIFARLSNGEYVINSAAVRKIGLPVLHAINSMRDPFRQLRGFADGGSVNLGGILPNIASAFSIPSYLRSLPSSFAGLGNLAPSLSGRPINLNLPGGQSFQMIADNNVAEKLASYLRGRTFASLGATPSWQGNR